MLTLHASAADPTGVVPAWWTPLCEASPQSSFYLSPTWLRTWLEVYGPRFKAEWLRWDLDGRPVAGCLLVRGVYRQRGIPFRTIFLNATARAPDRLPAAEHNLVTCLEGHEGMVAEHLLRYLDSQSWDAVQLSAYDESGLMGRLARGLNGALVRSEPRPSPYVDLTAITPGMPNPALSRRARAQIRRCRALYEGTRGPLSLASASGLEEALGWLDRLAELHTVRWRSKGYPGSFGTEPARRFHRQLISRLWPAGQVDVLRLRAGEHDVGYLYNFKEGAKVYSFQSGFAYEKDWRIKPGLLMHTLAIEHYALAGFREYDFLSGDARYKRSLAKASRMLRWTLVYRDRAWIRLLVWLWKAGGNPGDDALAGPPLPGTRGRTRTGMPSGGGF